MKLEKVLFKSDNLQLEGCLLMPPVDGKAPGVVLCHPHPLYGGSMNNNVVHAAGRALAGAGIASLRFNFRGAGQSEGSHDGGNGEINDTLAAGSYLAGCDGIDSNRIGLFGYSFGGSVALAAATREARFRAVVAVSPPAIPEFPGERPRLVVCGSADSLVPASSVLADKENLVAGGSDTDKIEVIEGADHFWHGFEEELCGLVKDFFSRRLGSVD